jgi:hypothetical protein
MCVNRLNSWAEVPFWLPQIWSNFRQYCSVAQHDSTIAAPHKTVIDRVVTRAAPAEFRLGEHHQAAWRICF